MTRYSSPAILMLQSNAIKYCKATPNFVDIDTETLGVCPKKLENYLKKWY